MTRLARIATVAAQVLSGTVLRLALIVGLALIAVRASGMLADRVVRPRRGASGPAARILEDRRAKTLAPLIKSAVRYVVYGLAFIMFLRELGLDPTGLIAGAGVVGLAVGFGAQNLVKDVITGFFLLFEDQYGVGDHVSIAGYEGIVEEISLRTTRIRDFGGQLHIVPNGQISSVTNYMGSAMRVMFEVPVSPQADVELALRLLREALGAAAGGIEGIVEGPTVLGMSRLGARTVAILVIARTQPLKQWAVERELKRVCFSTLKAANIALSSPVLAPVPVPSVVRVDNGDGDDGRV